MKAIGLCMHGLLATRRAPGVLRFPVGGVFEELEQREEESTMVAPLISRQLKIALATVGLMIMALLPQQVTHAASGSGNYYSPSVGNVSASVFGITLVSSCSLWCASFHVNYTYTGSSVPHWTVTPNYSSAGYSIQQTWAACAGGSNGGDSCGLNFTVSAIANGFPVSQTHGMRVQINTNGTIGGFNYW